MKVYNLNCVHSVIMLQTSKNRWKLVSIKGIVLVDDIMLANKHEAAEYVKKYVSSFLGWDYEIMPMEAM